MVHEIVEYHTSKSSKDTGSNSKRIIERVQEDEV
jgi:hypothetical protein